MARGLCNSHRAACEQKFPCATLATLIAIWTLATRSFSAIVGPLPNLVMSMFMKWWCCLRRDSFFVINMSCTHDVSPWCCFAVKPLLTWCTPIFLHSHCLCVILTKLLISLASHASTNPLGLYCHSIGFIASIRMYGILPSTMQSHPTQGYWLRWQLV